MPQIDISTFLSQAFWLLVCFCTLWFLIATYITPVLADINERRKRKINEYLQKAEKLGLQAKDALDKYNAIIAEAKSESETKMIVERDKLSSYLDNKNTIMRKKFAQDLAKHELVLEQEKCAANKEIDAIAQNLALEIVHKFGFKHINSKDIAKVAEKETVNG